MDHWVGDFYGGPGTGALGGPPSGHNWKRAVYRAAPKEFVVEVLQPTKFGSGYCYGMRITALQTAKSDAHSMMSGRSASSISEYEVWRRWEDCLWFQEILETEYALMARQKRARLVAGKGVKKNGIYVHSDQAASFESLPPGPDANMIAKDVHEIVPRLTKKGTLFRPSQATVEQRGREFEAMINALFQEGVPSLVKELRESRLCRDFFGYWRRDLDHDRKRGKVPPSGAGRHANGTDSARQSVASSAFSMYFSASNISLQLPNAFSDLPPSSAVPSFRDSTSRPSSMVRADAPRPLSDAKPPPVHYATSDSSASTASLANASQGPQSASSAPHDLTFFVSDRGSLALALPEDDCQAEHSNVPLSAPARVQPSPWTQDAHRPCPSEDDARLENGQYVADGVPPWPDVASAEFNHGLQALPEDCELIPAPSTTPRPEIEEVPRVPVRRQRNNSCPDPTNRNCLIFSPDAPRSSGPTSGAFATIDELHLDTSTRRPHSSQLLRSRIHPDSMREPQTPLTETSSSRAGSSLFSSFPVDTSCRTSWRTSMASVASETSLAPSFTSSFANGSCADFGRPRVASPESVYADRGSSQPADEERGRETALGYRRHQQRESVTTIGSMLSDLSIDSSILPRSLTPPPGGSLRRSLSAGSRRAPSVIGGFGLPGSEELWYDQQEDLIDAYFYDPGIHAPTVRPKEPPRTPPRKVPQEPFRQEIASPDRFPKPFRDRPAGQFHLPWSPPEPSSRTSTPSTPPASPPISPSLSSARPTGMPVRASTSPTPKSPGTPTGAESLTLKAILNSSIVLLRVARSAPLAEVRERLRDKLAFQEGVKLTPTFVIGWAPPGAAAAGPGTREGGPLALRGRPRSNSASSVGSLNPQALRYVYTEQDWQAALAACPGGKMTVRLFNARPI
ncbi:hypothetical protein BD414DRAFT_960 [Trametes punicea]|nr:hypothetical protein BD414DRAFT_960 [Trametes punicea]